ncbi:hypothetical protein [Niabella drilacis]|uniref:Uncharacterized protein n=1 Tax=Niabella drilacis (strain DSM 25811 / CCM 8410 / CCUG 62505 / LMG 26954 / E90) TaxID=1285928 RepID=A0A1G6SE17_NIADE|nr:hypothetical protein [Niabella drilacis]SDD15109.1 hypothetical protein SAMN04487894_106194 [Niabella drilacis]
MNDPKEDLQHIRQMMERSSRFISLNGLSGVAAGTIALIGAAIAYCLFQQYGIDYFSGDRYAYSYELEWKLFLLAAGILILALGSGILFTIQKSKRNGLKIWTSTTRLLLGHLLVPLIAGGLFCLALFYHGLFGLIAPATLLFYGLALVNAAKYTFSDIQYLGYCEIFLGIMASFVPGYGLIFWALGFGILHIIYGLLMYKKYK